MNRSLNNFKYCPRCGSKNKVKANFCHKCGFKFKDIDNKYWHNKTDDNKHTTPINDSSDKLRGIDENAERSFKYVGIFIVGIIALVVVCLAIGMHSSSEYNNSEGDNSGSSTTNVDSEHQEAEHEANVIDSNSSNLDGVLMSEYQNDQVVGDHIDVNVDTTSNQDTRVQDMWNEMYDDKNDADSIPVNIEAEGVVVATGTTDSGDLSFDD